MPTHTNGPICALCSGALVEESKVVTRSDGHKYLRAWVCRECSAAWPIAVTTKGFLGTKYAPLYRRGERAG